MKRLFSKILLAQVLTVMLALLVVTLITRVSLERGLKQFLEAQEQTVLQSAAAVLSQVYDSASGWEALRKNPAAWQRILRESRPPDRQGRGGPPPHRQGNGPETGPDMGLWHPFERLRSRSRLFLLDEHGDHIAGAQVPKSGSFSTAEVLVNGQAVGQVGFVPMGNRLPQSAQRFLRSQATILIWSGLISLVLASLLAYLVARHLSRPVKALDDTVGRLTEGQYDKRVDVRTRDEIGRLARNVNQLAETLQRNRSARQRWMADIAHELRTPIAILKGEVEALQDGIRPLDEAFLASMGEEVGQLSVLVDDLQTLALSDMGALNIDRQRVDLGELIRAISQAYADRLQARGIQFDLVLPRALECSADATRLRQLFSNLFENCVRYVETGGRVRLTATQSQAGIDVVLEDSGPGVDPKTFEQLFDRLYRAEPSRSRQTGGSGLGLAICRNIVEAHGGTIQAMESRLGGLKIAISLEQ